MGTDPQGWCSRVSFSDYESEKRETWQNRDSCSRDTSHTSQRRLLTPHKPTEQKLIDNKTQLPLKWTSTHLDTSLLDMTEGNGVMGKKKYTKMMDGMRGMTS